MSTCCTIDIEIAIRRTKTVLVSYNNNNNIIITIFITVYFFIKESLELNRVLHLTTWTPVTNPSGYLLFIS